jgi:hypothetical protein
MFLESFKNKYLFLGDPVLNKPSFSFAENSDGMISNANNGGLLEALIAPGDPEPDPDDPSRQWKQRNRHQLWSIAGGGAGAAYHQSFDERLRSASRQSFSNSCSNLDDQVGHYRPFKNLSFGHLIVVIFLFLLNFDCLEH